MVVGGSSLSGPFERFELEQQRGFWMNALRKMVGAKVEILDFSKANFMGIKDFAKKGVWLAKFLGTLLDEIGQLPREQKRAIWNPRIDGIQYPLIFHFNFSATGKVTLGFTWYGLIQIHNEMWKLRKTIF